MKTIKMIMDVPIDVYTRFVALNLGTPLDEVFDKIREEINAMSTDYCGGYIGLSKEEVLKIIDKYTKGEEE